MKKSYILVLILSAMPSYFSLFGSALTSSLILCISTMIGLIITGTAADEDISPDYIRTGWMVHLLGICLVVFVKNVIQ